MHMDTALPYTVTENAFNYTLFLSLFILVLQIDAVSLVYYRKEDNELKYLDLEASIEELITDSDLVVDK